MSLRGWVSENSRTIVGLGALYIGYVEFGSGSYPEIPEWSPLVIGAALAAGAVALFTSGALEDLLPDERGVFLQVVNARNTEAIETWELSEDQWEELTVVGGQLNHLSECKHRAYECLSYNPEDNVAVATWRLSKPASELVGHYDITDALEEIEEIRSDLEPEARFSGILRRRLPSVIRTLDRQRAVDQNRTLEPHLTPTFDEDLSIDEVLRDSIDEDYLPARLRNDPDGEGDVGDDMGGVAAGLELLGSLGGNGGGVASVNGEAAQNGSESGGDE